MRAILIVALAFTASAWAGQHVGKTGQADSELDQAQGDNQFGRLPPGQIADQSTPPGPGGTPPDGRAPAEPACTNDNGGVLNGCDCGGLFQDPCPEREEDNEYIEEAVACQMPTQDQNWSGAGASRVDPVEEEPCEEPSLLERLAGAESCPEPEPQPDPNTPSDPNLGGSCVTSYQEFRDENNNGVFDYGDAYIHFDPPECSPGSYGQIEYTCSFDGARTSQSRCYSHTGAGDPQSGYFSRC